MFQFGVGFELLNDFFDVLGVVFVYYQGYVFSLYYYYVIEVDGSDQIIVVGGVEDSVVCVQIYMMVYSYIVFFIFEQFFQCVLVVQIVLIEFGRNDGYLV